MKTLISLVSLSVLSVLHFVSSSEAQTFVLDFSSKDTFDVVFESGLRPKRVSGFESSAADVKNVSLELVFAEDIVFRFDAARVEFHVMKDDLLGGVSMTSHKLTVEQAREMLLTISEDIGLNMDALNPFLDEVSRNPIAFRSDQFAVSRYIEDDAQVGFGFRNTFSSSQPLIAEVGITWSNRFEKNLFLRSPIPPPKGWEHVSLDSDEPIGSTLDNMIVYEKGGLVSGESFDESKGVDRPGIVDIDYPWRYVFIVTGIVLILVVIGFYVCKKRRSF